MTNALKKRYNFDVSFSKEGDNYMLAEFAFNLLLTVVLYLLVPSIIVFAGRKFEKKTIKRICLINCIIIWVVFRIIQIAAGIQPTSGAAVFIWGSLGYWMLKKYCSKESRKVYTEPSQSESHSFVSTKDSANYDGEKDKAFDEASLKPVKSVKLRYCSHCGNAIDPHTKQCTGCGKQYFKGLSSKVVLAILLTISIVGNTLLVSINYRLKNELSDLEQKYKALQQENISLNSEISEVQRKKDFYYEFYVDNSAKLKFFDTSIVFIENDGTKYYHKYECSKFVGSDYWAHNSEYARYIGYYPCPDCYD